MRVAPLAVLDFPRHYASFDLLAQSADGFVRLMDPVTVRDGNGRALTAHREASRRAGRGGCGRG